MQCSNCFTVLSIVQVSCLVVTLLLQLKCMGGKKQACPKYQNKTALSIPKLCSKWTIHLVLIDHQTIQFCEHLDMQYIHL